MIGKELKEKLKENSYEDSDPFTGREFVYVKKSMWNELMDYLEKDNSEVKHESRTDLMRDYHCEECKNYVMEDLLDELQEDKP